MIGEIRDAETGNISIQAALTGHLVLSTIHTNSAIGTVSRLIDMGIESFLISSVLSCVIGQRLVRRICEDCKEPYNPPASALEFWGLEDDRESKFLRGTGCHRCRQTGYRGRIGIYEVLKIDDQLKSLIANGVEESVLLKTALASGHYTTMKQDALIKVQKGLTTLEEVTAEIAL
jgi:type IV pilus assembly protein PilB